MYYIPRFAWVVAVFCFLSVGWPRRFTFLRHFISALSTAHPGFVHCVIQFISLVFIFVLYSAPSAVGTVFQKARSFLHSGLRFSAIVFCSTLPYSRRLLDICSLFSATIRLSPPHPLSSLALDNNSLFRAIHAYTRSGSIRYMLTCMSFIMDFPAVPLPPLESAPKECYELAHFKVGHLLSGIPDWKTRLVWRFLPQHPLVCVGVSIPYHGNTVLSMVSFPRTPYFAWDLEKLSCRKKTNKSHIDIIHISKI
jgi:hypothetical protein